MAILLSIEYQGNNDEQISYDNIKIIVQPGQIRHIER